MEYSFAVPARTPAIRDENSAEDRAEEPGEDDLERREIPGIAASTVLHDLWYTPLVRRTDQARLDEPLDRSPTLADGFERESFEIVPA
jgi:hypothetical protein